MVRIVKENMLLKLRFSYLTFYLVIRKGLEPLTHSLEGRSYIPLTIDPINTIVFESFLFNLYALRLFNLLSSLSSRESNVRYMS